MNQANGRYGPQPAPEEVINKLPKVTMSKELLANDSIQDCAVCKDNFEENDEALTYVLFIAVSWLSLIALSL